MKEFLILRLLNAAIDFDRRNNANMAALLTEAVEELEKSDAEIRNLRSEIEKTAR